MNSSFVSLIPKVADSVRVTNFRPIVMDNFIYKVFTKIIASRLGSFIRDILSPSQFGFIHQRRIHTCITLSSEAINNLDTGKNGSIALKVDITTAFDMVSWNFLIQVLRSMNFLDRFIQMVLRILHSSRLSILITAIPTATSPILVVFVRVILFRLSSFAWWKKPSSYGLITILMHPISLFVAGYRDN